MIKLISCHIENFGKITNLGIDFDKGLTEIVKENGYGKTTIAVFIKAMFFGLPSTRANEKVLGDRQHYYPFNSQKFGGNLTYEKDGKTYRIERFFDKKTDTKDEFKVYENGTLVTSPENYVGESLFDIDEDAFMRTLFITCEQIEVTSTSKISSKLNNIIDNSDDDNNYEKAYEIIENIQKEYKMRGDKGLIKNKNQEILDLNDDIRNLESISDTLNVKYQKFNQVKSQMLEYQDKFEKSNQTIAIIENFKTYDELLNEVETSKKNLAELEKAFSSGVPTKADIENLKTKTQSGYEKYQKVNALKGDNVLFERLDNLKNEFKQGVPANQVLDEISSKITSLNTLNLVSEKQPKKSPIITIACLLGVIAGVGLAFLNLIAGIVLGGVCLIGAILSLVLDINKSATTKSSEDKNRLVADLNAFFAQFNYSGNNYESNLLDLKGKINLYGILLNEVNQKTQAVAEEEEILNEMVNDVKSQVNKMGFELSGNLKTTVDGIESLCLRYENLKEKYSEALNKAENFKKDKNLTVRPDVTKEEIKDNTNKFQIAQSDFYKIQREIEEDEKQVENLGVLYAKLEKAKEDLIKLKAEYDVYTKTLNYLSTAEKNLNERYVAPIKDRFNFYAKKLEKALNEKMYMDKDFKISFEDYGEYHSQKHLSYGQTAMCNLCIRFALIDNIFSGNLPFVILDDPFIGLDEQNFTNMQKLIKDLAQDRQIIYFTCHESRKIS